MKAKKHIFKSALLLSAAAMMATSCQDWLTVYPQTQVVEEQFWEDKNDLEGVRYAAYKQMCNTVDKLVMWGDLRADSYDLWSETYMTEAGYKSLSRSYRQMREGRMEKDSANSYFDWGDIYTTINYCNKVLKNGPAVLERDKQFTPSEWRQMKAEMTALRALNYFYLLRSFKDIPYTTKVINNDSEVQSFGATNQLVVLDSLIADVELVKGQARNRFSSNADTKGCITNAAIYALLSDMYLWRASLHEGRGIENDSVFVHQTGELVHYSVDGDYQLAVDNADEAMAALNHQIQQQNMSFGMGSSNRMLSYGLSNVNLIRNNFDNFTQGLVMAPSSHQSIFIQGNSEESIFELQFNSADGRENPIIGSLWGNGADHFLIASEEAMINNIYGEAALANRDSRIWYSAWGTVMDREGGATKPKTTERNCFKWKNVDFVFPSTVTDYLGANLCLTLPSTDDNYKNWIIYRLSDVMLQKAEALACLGGAENQKEAMKLVNALHRRSFCNDSEDNVGEPNEDVSDIDQNSWGTLDDFTPKNLGNIPLPNTTGDKWEIAVLNERQIELLAEGKRWFDLVRFAERHANDKADNMTDVRESTDEMPINSGMVGVEIMLDQFMPDKLAEALKPRLKNRYGLYNLIYYMEIKASNGMLEQNPVWNKSTYDK